MRASACSARRDVFKANTPGAWIFPDAMDAERLVHVALRLPVRRDPLRAQGRQAAGSRRRRSTSPTSARTAPTLSARELKLAGDDIGFRATLCRCGASKHKPFCDGSHNDARLQGDRRAGDAATSEPLAVRDGPLEIEPQRNGPLVVTGNLEICSGTGRTIDRVTRARLCRCGGSRNKPFCDNTHLKIGFEADGN